MLRVIQSVPVSNLKILSLVAGLTILCLSLHSHSQDGATALFTASQNGHTSTVDALLRNGADPNIAKAVSL